MVESISTLRDFSDLIGVVYDSAMEKTQWKRLLAALSTRHPGFMGAVYTQEGERFVGMYNPDGFNSFSQSVYEQYTINGRVEGITDDQNDHRRELLRRIDPKIGDVYHSRDIFTDEEFRASTSYKTVLAPAGIGHWVSLKFAESGPREAVFIFFENEQGSEEPDAVALKQTFQLISPHVVRATRIARALTMAREASAAFHGFLDAIALPMIVVDRQAHLIFSNTAGRRLMDREAVLLLDKSQKLATTASGSQAITQQLEEVETSAMPAGMLLHEEAGSISLCITPFHPEMNDSALADQDLFKDRQLFAIFVGTQDDVATNPNLLADTFGLTPREAEVCAALLRGQSPTDIAGTTQRSQKTVRNQIQSAYEKVGVNSFQELNEALAVFKLVGAMFNPSDDRLFEMRVAPE